MLDAVVVGKGKVACFLWIVDGTKKRKATFLNAVCPSKGKETANNDSSVLSLPGGHLRIRTDNGRWIRPSLHTYYTHRHC